MPRRCRCSPSTPPKGSSGRWCWCPTDGTCGTGPPTSRCFTTASGGGRVVDVAGKDGWRGFDDNAAAARREERAEESRLLYVALTRARHHLVVWWVKQIEDAPTSTLGKLLARDSRGRRPPAPPARAGGRTRRHGAARGPPLRGGHRARPPWPPPPSTDRSTTCGAGPRSRRCRPTIPSPTRPPPSRPTTSSATTSRRSRPRPAHGRPSQGSPLRDPGARDLRVGLVRRPRSGGVAANGAHARPCNAPAGSSTPRRS
jgi:hypothetical protein